jgi:RimJ/RimL family protein N-acetyltransferase
MPTPSLPLADQDIESLERATLDAVAPPAWEELPGWLLPFDHSTIGRAKSAVPLRHSGIDTAAISAIEARYAAQGLAAAFRIADLPALASVHAELHFRGYRAEQPTLVQVGSAIAMRALCSVAPAQRDRLPSAAWAGVYTAAGFDPVDGAHRVQALSRSACAVYAHITGDEAAPWAAGVGTYSQGWASIHGMRTVISQRGQGLATRVMAALADEAMVRGLECVFLQVEEENVAANALYRRAGFVAAWRYHYWRKPSL